MPYIFLNEYYILSNLDDNIVIEFDLIHGCAYIYYIYVEAVVVEEGEGRARL